jgi:hypothetical protein
MFFNAAGRKEWYAPRLAPKPATMLHTGFEAEATNSK